MKLNKLPQAKSGNGYMINMYVIAEGRAVPSGVPDYLKEHMSLDNLRLMFAGEALGAKSLGIDDWDRMLFIAREIKPSEETAQ